MRNGNSIRVFLYFFLFSCIFFSCSSEKDSILVDSWEEEDGVQVGFHIAFEESISQPFNRNVLLL